jgi:two-component system, sporulation sensor kinase E
MKAGFLEKLISRLGKIGPEEVQNYLLRLAQEKGFLETVFNAIQEGIIVTDSSGRITYLNEAACELFGLVEADAIGKQLGERVRGLDWQSFTRSGGPVTRDLEIFYPANRFINFYIVPLVIEHRESGIVVAAAGGRGRNARARDTSAADDYNAGTNDTTAVGDRGYNDARGDQVGYAIILRDITESRRTAEKAIEGERLNALTLLAAGVAHEIGNPLNSLNIHLQLMERQARKLTGKTRAKLEESIDIARGEISRLDSIVTQFLRAIRPSKPQLRAENINTIVEEAVQFFGPEIEARDIVVETELSADMPLLQLDRDQMKQAFYNIMKNSFEAMKSRGILRIRTDATETHVRVSFTDSGGGMSADALSRVFEPYYTTKASGSGLGLLIVRRIVREHGGELAIESTEGRGLTLTIRLPLADQRVRMLEAGTKIAA